MSTTQELILIDKQAQKMHNKNNNMKQIEEYFGYINNFSELGNLGLKLQIIKKILCQIIYMDIFYQRA